MNVTLEDMLTKYKKMKLQIERYCNVAGFVLAYNIYEMNGTLFLDYVYDEKEHDIDLILKDCSLNIENCSEIMTCYNLIEELNEVMKDDLDFHKCISGLFSKNICNDLFPKINENDLDDLLANNKVFNEIIEGRFPNMKTKLFRFLNNYSYVDDAENQEQTYRNVIKKEFDEEIRSRLRYLDGNVETMSEKHSNFGENGPNDIRCIEDYLKENMGGRSDNDYLKNSKPICGFLVSKPFLLNKNMDALNLSYKGLSENTKKWKFVSNIIQVMSKDNVIVGETMNINKYDKIYDILDYIKQIFSIDIDYDSLDKDTRAMYLVDLAIKNDIDLTDNKSMPYINFLQTLSQDDAKLLEGVKENKQTGYKELVTLDSKGSQLLLYNNNQIAIQPKTSKMHKCIRSLRELAKIGVRKEISFEKKDSFLRILNPYEEGKKEEIYQWYDEMISELFKTCDLGSEIDQSWMDEYMEVEYEPDEQETDIVKNMKKNFWLSMRKTVMMNHLHEITHSIKAIIAMSKVGSGKTRIIFTPNPNNYFLLLPSNSIESKVSSTVFMNVTVQEKNNAVIKDIMKNMMIQCFTENHVITISKPCRLDNVRLKGLYNSLACFLTAFTANLKYVNLSPLSNEKDLKNVATMYYLSSLSVTRSYVSYADPLRYVCNNILSDGANIKDLFREKINFRPKNNFHLIMHYRIFNFMEKTSLIRKELKKNVNSIHLDDMDETFTSCGLRRFEYSTEVIAPYTNVPITNVEGLISETLTFFYMSKKSLHNRISNMSKIIKTPMEYEDKFDQEINQGRNNQYLNNDGGFYNVNEIYLNASASYFEKIKHNCHNVRNRILNNQKFNSSVFDIRTFTSSKSCIDFENKYVESKIESPSEVKNRLEDMVSNVDMNREKFFHDIQELINNSNDEEYIVYIYNKYRKLYNRKIITKLSKNINIIQSKKGLPKLHVLKKEDKTYYCTMDKQLKMLNKPVNHLEVKSGKVVDMTHKLSNHYGATQFDDLLYEIIKSDFRYTVTQFPKEQRTDSDRDIMQSCIDGRFLLYALEHSSLEVANVIRGEEISRSGSRKILDINGVKRSMIKTCKRWVKKQQLVFEDAKEEDLEKKFIDVSVDASKFSTGDTLSKFIIQVVANPIFTSKEKKVFLLCICKYYNKTFVIKEDMFPYIMKKTLARDDPDDLYSKFTKNFSQNFFNITENWLQGNLNYTASLCHGVAMHIMSEMLKVASNQKYYYESNSLYHSDDNTTTFLICQNPRSECQPDYENITRSFDKEPYKMCVLLMNFSLNQVGYRLNMLKTFSSSLIKEFLQIYSINCKLYIPPCRSLLTVCSDTSYNNPMDDYKSRRNAITESCCNGSDTFPLKVSLGVARRYSFDPYGITFSKNSNNKNITRIFSEPESKNLPFTVSMINKLPIPLLPFLSDDYNDLYRFLEIIVKEFNYDSVNENLEKFLIKILNSEEKLNKLERLIRKTEFENSGKSIILTKPLNEDMTINLSSSNSLLKLRSAISIKEISKSYSFEIYKLVLKNFEEFLEDSKRMDEMALKELYSKSVKQYKEGIRVNNDLSKDQENKFIMMTLAMQPSLLISQPKTEILKIFQILMRYSTRSFLESLTYQRPDFNFVSRILNSNSKMVYKNTIEDFELGLTEILEDDDLVKKTSQTIDQVLNNISRDFNNANVNIQNLVEILNSHVLGDRYFLYHCDLWFGKKLIGVKQKNNLQPVIPRIESSSFKIMHRPNELINTFMPSLFKGENTTNY